MSNNVFEYSHLPFFLSLLGQGDIGADIPGSVIGKILIEDHQTLVDVPQKFAATVINKSGSVQIRRQPLVVQKA